MIATFVRLKLRLLRNQLRRGRQQVAGLVVVLALGLLGAGAASLVVAAGRAEPAVFADLCVLFAALLSAAWLVLPIAASGIDTTLDVGRLALLPLRGRTHAAGLLAASLVGVGPLATLVVQLGFVAHGVGPLGIAMVGAAVTVQTVQVALLGRVATATLGAMLQRRRTRELAFSLGVLLTGSVGFGAQVLSSSVRGVSSDALGRWAQRAAWNPFGLAGRAAAVAIDGGDAGGGGVGWVLPAGGLLLGALAIAALSARLWWLLVVRELTTTAAPAGPSARRRSRLRARSPVGAVLARELRYLWRHPVARTNTITSFVLSALYLLPQRSHLDDPPAVLLAAALVGTVGLSALNMLAIDGRAAATDVLCAPLGQVLAGKAAARLVLALAVVAVVASGLAASSGGWGYVPAALGIAGGMVGPILGVGAFASVAAPVPVPDVAGGNPWSAAPGQGCVTALASFGLFVVAGVAALPVVAAAVLAQVVLDRPAVLAVVALLAPGYGWLTWHLGAAAATRRAQGRVPELLAALAPA
ncbi:MAG: hypothetical protein AB7W59_11370 [Acidimicrobiia bacterium]